MKRQKRKELPKSDPLEEEMKSEEPMMVDELSSLEKEWVEAEFEARLGRPRRMVAFLRVQAHLYPEIDLPFIASLIEKPPTEKKRGPKPSGLDPYQHALRGDFGPLAAELTTHAILCPVPDLYKLRNHLQHAKRGKGRPRLPVVHKQWLGMAVAARVNFLMRRRRLDKAAALRQVAGEIGKSESSAEKLDALGRTLMASISSSLVEGV